MSDSSTTIEGWAILELFGHHKIAGYVTTAILGTSGMLRVDVPEMEEAPGFTRFYGPGALYSLTLVTEAVARAALRELRPPAVTVYIPRQLSAPMPEAGEASHHASRYWQQDDDETPCRLSEYKSCPTDNLSLFFGLLSPVSAV